jgi:glucose-1-phosphate cytidylyltransferase
MVEIGGKPLLWHILNLYSEFDCNDFVVALGYKGEVIKEYFRNYYELNSDILVDFRTGKTTVLGGTRPPWQLHLADTGQDTLTGGRLGRLRGQTGDGTFMMTYGDGLADVDIQELVSFHRAHGKLATVTIVRPPARFGGVDLDGDQVVEFTEKPQTEGGWINGGFFVLEPSVFEYISGDDSIWEREPLERLAADGQLMAFRHEGFWQAMDTVRDKKVLEELWDAGSPPWRTVRKPDAIVSAGRTTE